VAIALTTAALVIILSAMNGLTGYVANLYNAIEPDIKIMPLSGKFFEADENFISKIKSVQGVNQISKSIHDNALMKHGDKQAIVTIKGVDDNFKNVTRFDSVIKEGSFQLKHGTDRFAVFGRGVANQLDININNLIEQVAIYSPNRGLEENLTPEKNLKTSKASSPLQASYLYYYGLALNNKGYFEDHRGNQTEALEYYKRAIKIREDINDKKGLAASLNNIGYIYKMQGNIPLAIDCYNKSIRLQEQNRNSKNEIIDRKGLAYSYSNLGVIYKDNGDREKAIVL